MIFPMRNPNLRNELPIKVMTIRCTFSLRKIARYWNIKQLKKLKKKSLTWPVLATKKVSLAQKFIDSRFRSIDFNFGLSYSTVGLEKRKTKKQRQKNCIMKRSEWLHTLYVQMLFGTKTPRRNEFTLDDLPFNIHCHLRMTKKCQTLCFRYSA